MSLNNKNKATSPLVERKYLIPFILITSLFALWGFANDITNPMVAAFQTVMELSATKASMVQFAFYGGYATMAIPAALFIRRNSYKKGILLGLGLSGNNGQPFYPFVRSEGYRYTPLEPGPGFQPDGITLGYGCGFSHRVAQPVVGQT